MSNKKMVVTISILAALLLAAIVYIIAGIYSTSQQQKQLDILQQGATAGYQQAIVQLLQQAATCQAVPVSAQNVTLNLVAMECLQEGQGQAAQ